jgi:hypothetical protein
MGINHSHLKEEAALESSDEDDMSSESTLEEADKQVGIEQPIFLLDQNKYPLLHSLFSMNP